MAPELDSNRGSPTASPGVRHADVGTILWASYHGTVAMARRRPGRAPLDIDALRDLLGCRPFPESLWAAVMEPACHVRIGATPAAVGRERGLALLAQLYSMTAGLGADYWEACEHNDAVYVECELEIAGSGAARAPLPCMWVLRPASPPIADIRVYTDLNTARV